METHSNTYTLYIKIHRNVEERSYQRREEKRREMWVEVERRKNGLKNSDNWKGRGEFLRSRTPRFTAPVPALKSNALLRLSIFCFLSGQEEWATSYSFMVTWLPVLDICNGFLSLLILIIYLISIYWTSWIDLIIKMFISKYSLNLNRASQVVIKA